MLKKFRLLLLMTLAVTLMATSCNKDDDDNTDNPPSSPVVSNPLHVYGNYFYVNWIGVVGAQAYMTDVATDQEFNNILTDYNNKEVAINGMFVVDNLNINTTYFVRMRANNSVLIQCVIGVMSNPFMHYFHSFKGWNACGNRRPYLIHPDIVIHIKIGEINDNIVIRCTAYHVILTICTHMNT